MVERMSLFACQLALAKVSVFRCYIVPFLFDHKRGLIGGNKRSCAIIVYPLTALMVDKVRDLRKNGVQAVIVSCNSRESSVVGTEFLATDSSFTTASHIVFFPEALALTK